MALYEHLGVAVAFSPRLEALLAEAARFSHHLARRTSLIHAGEHSQERESRLREAAEAVGLGRDVAVHFRHGDPDRAILSVVEEYDIDMLLAGALEKERPLRYYLGSVAHNLVREAPCSLMLLTEPQLDPQPVRTMVVVANYSDQALVALRRAVRLAEREQTERVYVVRVMSEYGMAMVLAEGVRRERALNYQAATREQEESLLYDMVDAIGHTTVRLEPRVLEGRTGYIASQFAREHDADLLVMPSVSRHTHFFERLFASDMEWVLREIPCNLWVVRDPIP